MLKTGMIIAERYEILGKIGTGGMADVYKAKDHKLNRFVAVKVLKPEFREDTTFIRKFRSEAQAAAGLTHPNIVNVFDVGDDEGVYYIVMELIEGITLKEYIAKKGKLSIKEATSIAIQVSMGLEAAYWILIAFCLKGIWRLSSQSFNGRRQMLLVVLTVLMIRLPIYRKQ